MNEYKTGLVSRWIGQHENTTRTYSRRYKDFLSARANARRRRFTDDDVRVLFTIANLREQGISFEAITEALKAGRLIDQDKIPPAPDPEDEAIREEMPIKRMPQAEYMLEVQQYLQREIILKQEIERLTDERDEALTRLETETSDIRQQWRGEVDKLNERIVSLERERGILEGQLEIIQSERKPASYWLVIIAGAIAAVVIVAAVVVAVLIFSSGAG